MSTTFVLLAILAAASFAIWVSNVAMGTAMMRSGKYRSVQVSPLYLLIAVILAVLAYFLR